MLATKKQVAERDANLTLEKRLQSEEVQTRPKRLIKEKEEAKEKSGDSEEAVAFAASPAGSVYTACYCEENAYFLCQRLMQEKPDSAVYVVFVSNRDRLVRIPMLVRRY
jgi:hypothetical protein